MNTIKTITLLSSGLAALILLLMVLRLLLRKLRQEAEADSVIKPAYGIYLTALLLAGSKVLTTILTKVGDATDILTNSGGTAPFSELLRLCILFIGFGIVWLLLWLMVVRVFMSVMTTVKNEIEEMVLGNTFYFLIKGILLNCLVWLLDPVLLQWLKLFMPVISIPFIH